MGALAKDDEQVSGTIDVLRAQHGGRALAVARGAGRVRRLWDRRVHVWEHHGAAGLERVIEAVLAEVGAADHPRVVDLGCGNGQLSLPLARRGAHVLAVDISTRMIESVKRRAAAEGLEIQTQAVPAQELTIAPGSVDVVVSNYAMHHLYDDEKRAVLAAALTWLRPGGRVVIGDMMFGRGATKQDREIISAKVRVMLRRGPAGWWRIAKNVARFTLRMRERPLPMDAWCAMFWEVGLADVQARRVVAEAAVVAGTKPLV
jgi:SAM-dependent methyltransferase